MGSVAVWMIAVFDLDFDFTGDIGGVFCCHGVVRKRLKPISLLAR